MTNETKWTAEQVYRAAEKMDREGYDGDRFRACAATLSQKADVSVSDEDVMNRVAKSISDALGHGMREKCEHIAHAAISAYRLATWPCTDASRHARQVPDIESALNDAAKNPARREWLWAMGSRVSVSANSLRFVVHVQGHGYSHGKTLNDAVDAAMLAASPKPGESHD